MGAARWPLDTCVVQIACSGDISAGVEKETEHFSRLFFIEKAQTEAHDFRRNRLVS